MFKHGLIKLLILLIAVVVFLAFVASCFLKQKYVVPILMYHSVNPVTDKTSILVVRPVTFEKQMRYLKNNHYNILPLERLASLISGKKKLPPKAIAITFDDGIRDNFTYAFPVLKKYGIPATVFVIIDEVGMKNKLNWEEIKEMHDSGVAFGSHCLGPEPLTKINSEAELKRQIFDSKRILEEKLGERVSLFSYPEGMFNPKIRQLTIDAGYAACVATKPGLAYPNDDVFALKRLRISEKAANMLVFGFETSGYYNFILESKMESKRRKHGKR